MRKPARNSRDSHSGDISGSGSGRAVAEFCAMMLFWVCYLVALPFMVLLAGFHEIAEWLCFPVRALKK